MDISPKWSWAELCKRAANRDGWRQMVYAIKYGTGVTVQLNGTSCSHATSKRKSAHNNLPSSPSARKIVKRKTEAEKYRDRDAHAAFFRRKAKSSRRGPRTPAKKTKPRPLSTKERADFARAHYERNHGPHAILHDSRPILNWSPIISGHVADSQHCVHTEHLPSMDSMDVEWAAAAPLPSFDSMADSTCFSAPSILFRPS